MEKKLRYTVLDAVRGLAVIAMIIYHALWDMVYIFGVNMPWFGSASARVIQLSIRWAFIIISGFSWHLGRKKLRRSLTVIGASVLISLVTYIFMPEEIILFGVLSLIGSAMLVTIPLDKLMRKIHPYIGLALCAVLFTVLYNVPRGYVGIGDWVWFELPVFLGFHTIMAYFGFMPQGFFSTDYVPVLPWIFLFWCGYFLYLIMQKHNLLKCLSAFRVKPLEFVGRHSLLIYLLHQPLVYGLLFVIFSI